MNQNSSYFKGLENKNEFDLKKEFFRYLFFWKYFVLSISICLCVAFLINRYSPKLFLSTAKIKILDKNENTIQLPTAEDLFSNSKVNIENEIEIITSYPILKKVVENLNLNAKVSANGKIIQALTSEYPFNLDVAISRQNLFQSEYRLLIKENNLLIYHNDKEFIFNDLSTFNKKHNFPFNISNIDVQKWNPEGYTIEIYTTDQMINFIKSSIKLDLVGKKSEVIKISFISSNKKYSEIIINEIINVYNQDGIEDRQLISKRTIEFINNRYAYLSSELDSIEVSKQFFKKDNDLVDLSVNSAISLEKIVKSEENIFALENEISVSKFILNSLKTDKIDLLPSNLGVENVSINALINEFNENILKRKKILTTAGKNNPLVKQIDAVIFDSKNNIIFSLENHLQKLKKINDKLIEQYDEIDKSIDVIPAQEKTLRAIERNQQIKEALYLFLLQKREEAEVSFAVTEPSVKIVEYAISNSTPFSPNSNLIFFVALLLGLALPLIIIYFIFLFDNKIHSREDLERFSLNVLGEIPFFDLTEAEKVFTKPDDRTIISESFRMLMSNVRYLQKNDSSSNVILVTSSIKGEGKTLNALNLALSFSSVGKKVLLIGCDLRNPQLHKYINCDKSVSGLVDYLVDSKTQWKENIISPFDSQSLDILLSGPLPPNPLNLINNGNIDILLNDAKKSYDNIIIDSAPTLLVADTKSLINISDVLIFLTRCNVTDNEVLSHIQKISEESDASVGVVLNGVGQKNSYGYSYGYRYGYGYNYKYSYNYGYGYGYSSDEEKS